MNARWKLLNRWFARRLPWRKPPEAPKVSRSEIWPKIHDLFTQEMNLLPTEITPQAHFEKDLGMDSIDAVELTMAVEEAFGIEIPDEDAEKLLTMPDLLRYLEEHVSR